MLLAPPAVASRFMSVTFVSESRMSRVLRTPFRRTPVQAFAPQALREQSKGCEYPLGGLASIKAVIT